MMRGSSTQTLIGRVSSRSSRHPQFAVRAGRILDLDERHWQALRADELVLSTDEKTSIQARGALPSDPAARTAITEAIRTVPSYVARSAGEPVLVVPLKKLPAREVVDLRRPARKFLAVVRVVFATVFPLRLQSRANLEP